MQFNALNWRYQAMTTPTRVKYQTNPRQYKHWKLSFNGPVATLAVDIDENAGLHPATNPSSTATI
jgi:hypothetical protein